MEQKYNLDSIQSQINILSGNLSKVEISIEKLAEVSHTVSRILAVHEEKFDNQSKINDFNVIAENKLQTDFENRYIQINNELTTIKKNQDIQNKDFDKKFAKIEKLFYVISGISVTIGFLLSATGLNILKLIISSGAAAVLF